MNDVIGRVGYVAAMAERPMNHPVHEFSNIVFDWHDVLIRDARKIACGARLEKHGFTTLAHASAVADWEGDEWRAPFTQEIDEIVKRATGASRVMVTRNSGRSKYGFSKRGSRLAGNSGPAVFCHNDFTAGSAPRHLALDYPDLVPAMYAKHWAIYNVWHLVSAPPQSDPLAICDATSVAAWDLVPGEARYGDDKDNLNVFGENSMFRYNRAHRWFYYPDLRRDETLIWCGFNSDTTLPNIVPHTSFRDPSCQTPGAERTCVHGTVYAFFD